MAWAWRSDRQTDILPWLQEHLERELLREVLAGDEISQVKLADRLGMARNTFRARLKQYRLDGAPADRANQ